jgi:hypothetical protein
LPEMVLPERSRRDIWAGRHGNSAQIVQFRRWLIAS